MSAISDIWSSNDDGETGLYCFQHDTELKTIYIDDEGTWNDEYEVPNALYCPIEDCQVVIYEPMD